MNINLELYRIFCEASKTGNFTKAADNLFMSPSAVSQAMKQLENNIGGALFTRSKSGVKLTTEGEVLFSYINNALSIVGNAEEKISSMKKLSSGLIRIGASDTICSLFLLPILKSFKKTHPDIHMSVTNRITRESIDLLKNGTVDLSFVNLPIEDDPAIEITPVMSIHDCFVAGEMYSYLSKFKINLADLQKYPVLMLEKASNSRKQMDTFLSGYNIDITPAIELGSLSLLSDFAKIGLGIAATIKEDVQDDLEKGTLHELSFFEPLPARNIGLIQMKNVKLSFAAKAFIEFCYQQVFE